MLKNLPKVNKFRHDCYFTDNPEKVNYYFINISFDKMIETCSHEITHYIHFVKYGKSSCESDLVLNNGNYDEELAREHEKWTREIYGMIKEKYGEWERWKGID